MDTTSVFPWAKSENEVLETLLLVRIYECVNKYRVVMDLNLYWMNFKLCVGTKWLPRWDFLSSEISR